MAQHTTKPHQPTLAQTQAEAQLRITMMVAIIRQLVHVAQLFADRTGTFVKTTSRTVVVVWNSPRSVHIAFLSGKISNKQLIAAAAEHICGPHVHQWVVR